MATSPCAHKTAGSTRSVDDKVGLALSGGGFRAAFFHVGVLARLAELGVLPRVEVISTVSGGSIVGAAYYLVLKNRLEDATKGPITNDDYVGLVREVERKLLHAVRKNIRGRVFANPVKTIRMAWPSYSRSDRIGDLYDRHLYKEIWRERQDGSRERKWWGLGPEKQIAMHELAIKPHAPTNGSDPPILWINATSLNTGHNWRFGTCRMGEPLPESKHKRAIVNDVDKNMRLIRGLFEENPDPSCKAKPDEPWVGQRQEDFPLALAVAASACVPLLFHPLSISGMYAGTRVELVDGGVQDNQGIQGLLDEECNYMIISDASGQMNDLERPSTLLPSVAGRTMSIYGDRIRDEQLAHALTDADGMALLHLRKGLEAKAVSPISSPTPPRPERQGEFTSDEFGVHEGVQEALSRIRTDLDYFGDSEAFSLMLDGYLMSDREFERSQLKALRHPHAPGKAPDRWDFGKDVHRRIATAPSGLYGRQLRAGSQRFLRTIATFWPGPPWVFIALAIAAVAGLAVIVWHGAIGGAVGDVWRDQWSAKAVIVAVGALLLLLVAYLAMAIQWPPIRYPVALLWVVLAIVPALILCVWRWIALPGRHLARRLGKVPAQSA